VTSAPTDALARRKSLPGRARPAASECPERRRRGFTLPELLVALAIAAVLAALAVPSYADHLRRARLAEATSRLADHRLRMEQFFLDYRRYDDGSGGCGAAVSPPAAGDAFALSCTAAAAAYLVTATGIAGRGMQGFTYTIDQANLRATPAVPDGWVGSDRCWVTRRDGTCA
jgi:type IV pilus assembly protein PilE